MFQNDKDITGFTTFGIPVKAKLFAEYSNVNELVKICRSEEFRENPVFHIGGGSNLLFEGDFDGLILHSGIKGMIAYRKDADTVFAIAGAGEKWTDFVDFTISQGLGGLENLAGIPGEVGASPVQNVGAYGVEAGDFIHSVECLDRETLKVVTFTNYPGREGGNECGFSYRNSNFKTIWKDRYFVLRVSFRLHPEKYAKNLSHGGLRNLEERLGRRPTILDVREEVLRIRNSKLPDPAHIGSAGSFFKNPVMRRRYYEYEVLNLDPDVPHYDLPGDEMHVKVPAGWLIEHAGLKGCKIGGAEVYPDNCLVIANDGTATAADVRNLAEEVYHKVMAKYHIPLTPEVNYVSTEIKVTVLGSGTSKGVPELMCDCEVCHSSNPKDKRLRASVLVQTMGLNILIDPSPDFREQALRFGLHSIDAILITHEHYDHVGGIDDLRPFCFNSDLNLYVREDVDRHLRSRLDYCFRENKYPGTPSFKMHVIDNRPFYIKGIKITPIEVIHGKLPIFGYRIGKFAYITDAKTISEEEKEKLEGVELLIVNALRRREHFAHFTVDQALELISEVNPQKAYLTHLCHEVGLHDEFDDTLPANVSPCHDMLTLTSRL